MAFAWIGSVLFKAFTKCAFSFSYILFFFYMFYIDSYTAISRKVVGKNVHATIPKGNMGYHQYAVPDNVAVKHTFVAFL